MSANAPSLPPSPADVKARKGGTPLVCLTAYTTPVARMVDAQCDVVLVGDSVGMVLHGLPSTLSVTLDRSAGTHCGLRSLSTTCARMPSTRS